MFEVWSWVGSAYRPDVNGRRSKPGGFAAISRWLSAATPPETFEKSIPHPGGVPLGPRLVQIFWVIFHAGLLQHFNQLFAKCSRPVVPGLIGNVALDRVTPGRAHGERGIPFLPREFSQTDFRMHPRRRRFFQFAHD